MLCQVQHAAMTSAVVRKVLLLQLHQLSKGYLAAAPL